MQKLCCVRTRQHPLAVWSHKFVLSSTTHISTNSHPFLVGIVSTCPSTPERNVQAHQVCIVNKRLWTQIQTDQEHKKMGIESI